MSWHEEGLWYTSRNIVTTEKPKKYMNTNKNMRRNQRQKKRTSQSHFFLQMW